RRWELRLLRAHDKGEYHGQGRGFCYPWTGYRASREFGQHFRAASSFSRYSRAGLARVERAAVRCGRVRAAREERLDRGVRQRGDKRCAARDGPCAESGPAYEL